LKNYTSILLLFFLTACGVGSEEPVLAGAREIDTVGDGDGFGFGLENNLWRSNSEGFFDFRDSHETFTDVFPVIRHMGQSIDYTHEFNVPGVSIIKSASISLRTFGLQDGDPGLVGEASDLKLFLDGIEIPNAFDDVDQFFKLEGKSGSIAGNIRMDVPQEVLSKMRDGLLDVKLIMEIDQKDVHLMDAFAIDYSQLQVTMDIQ
jgi:hypothetical protein